MTIRQITGLAFCILSFSLASFGQARALATWQVQKYDLDVSLPQDEKTRSLTAKAVLNIKNISGSPAGTLTLRISPAAEVTAVQMNGATADFAKSQEPGVANLQRIAIRFPSAAADGVVTATVDYKLSLKDNSALAAFSPAGAHFLPLSFWYPTPNSWYFTRGADSAPVRIKVNAAGGHSVVSSGVEGATGFEQKLNGQPFFVTGSWDALNASGVTVYTPKGINAEGQKRATELAALLIEARTFAAGILGNAPDGPLKIVANRRGAGFSSAGTVIVDESIFRRSKVDSLTAMNIAEAAAKLWLGGSITVNGEGYGVITEGLSRYIATQFIESKFGKDVAAVERLRQRTSYASVSKRDGPMSTVSPLDDFYYPEVANKGAMAWRLLVRRSGIAEFSNAVKSIVQDGNLTLPELRAAFSAQKDLLDYLFDQVTDMNLIVGLPVAAGGETTVQTRNTGAADVTVDIVATTATGERLVTPATIKGPSYSETVFRTNAKVTRVEIDADKLYPQTDYSDDVKPQESTENDPFLAAKRLFDKQDFAGTETTARNLLRDKLRFDDLRILLARALLAQNKNTEAEREFQVVLDEKLPTSRSLAWANVGLGEVAARSNQNQAALKFAEAAIMADAEYGASLAARNLRTRLGHSSTDATVKTFFADFDRSATGNRKADLDAFVLSGEVSGFAGGIAGGTEQWQTQIRAVDRLDANTVLVETSMSIKLLNKDPETGLAVYRLVKVGSGWKLAAVEMFEVR